MDDSSSSDDETNTPLSQLGNKKLKLNNGSSQDSFKTPDSGLNKDDNMDSGVSVDKSESTSSDGPSTSNNLVNGAIPRESVETFLINIGRRTRNYRKRKTPDRDSDSSRDSDDLSADEVPVHEPYLAPNDRDLGNTTSETESDDHMAVNFGTSDSGSGSSNSSSDSDATYESGDGARFQSEDEISDDDEHNWVLNNVGGGDSCDESSQREIVLKPQPKNNFVILRELIHREMGLSHLQGKSVHENLNFERGFYGSLHTVYRMQKLCNLNKHKGCVNAINFHPQGDLLVSGSDDMNIVIWDWAKQKALQTIKTGHKSNVFQSKFLPLNAQSQMNIVTCARDGQVRLVSCAASGGSVRRRLCAHARPAHKLHVSAREPHRVLSAGEDGVVMLSDVRADHATRLFHVKDRGSSIPLYSIHAHPLDTKEIIVAGRDKYVRLYDTRLATKPVAWYCPGTFFNRGQATNTNHMRLSLTHLTCAVFNHDGTEILGSYNDEDIYLFHKINDGHDRENLVSKVGYTHKYSGHRNSATFKGVSFFGPKSEYIVSGSDCSYIYIWEKESEAIVQWMPGDTQGVVNCIEAHPKFPILATSGLDKDVKIWIPNNSQDPTFDGLDERIHENSKASIAGPLFNDFLPTLYDAIHERITLFNERPDDGRPRRGDIEFEGNVCTTM